MGADKHEKHKHGRLPPFVPLLVATLDSPAWRALSHGAKALYVCLRRRYNQNNHNNGRIYLSHRLARKELRSGYKQIARWYDELQFYGFIVMTTPGHLGVEGQGTAPRWRLTELGYMKEPQTQEFLKWDGRLFGKPRPAPPPRKTKPRYGKPLRTVTEIHNTRAMEIHNAEPPKRYGKPSQAQNGSVTENHSRTSLPSIGSSPVSLTASRELIELERRRALRAPKSAQARPPVRRPAR